MTWPAWMPAAWALLAGAALALPWLGARRWRRSARALADQLEATRTDGTAGPRATHVDLRELDGLPAPVQRYFRAVLQPGQPIVTAATIALAGRFNLSASGARWRPFRSRQRVVTQRPGFVWDAEIALLPGVAVRVVDSCIAGRGGLRAAVLGLFTVADVHGDGEIARGEFMRYFAEAPWYPTALLPSQGVHWQAVDAHTATASLSDGPLALTLSFRFGDNGLIESFRAEARGAMVGSRMQMLPWEGRWSDYRRCGGMTVPFTGEVAWIRPEGRRPYFVGSVTSLHHDVAR